MLFGLTSPRRQPATSRLDSVDGYPHYALPAGVYALTMYILIAPFIIWRQLMG